MPEKKFRNSRFSNGSQADPKRDTVCGGSFYLEDEKKGATRIAPQRLQMELTESVFRCRCRSLRRVE